MQISCTWFLTPVRRNIAGLWMLSILKYLWKFWSLRIWFWYLVLLLLLLWSSDIAPRLWSLTRLNVWLAEDQEPTSSVWPSLRGRFELKPSAWAVPCRPKVYRIYSEGGGFGFGQKDPTHEPTRENFRKVYGSTWRWLPRQSLPEPSRSTTWRDATGNVTWLKQLLVASLGERVHLSL